MQKGNVHTLQQDFSKHFCSWQRTISRHALGSRLYSVAWRSQLVELTVVYCCVTGEKWRDLLCSGNWSAHVTVAMMCFYVLVADASHWLTKITRSGMQPKLLAHAVLVTCEVTVLATYHWNDRSKNMQRWQWRNRTAIHSIIGHGLYPRECRSRRCTCFRCKWNDRPEKNKHAAAACKSWTFCVRWICARPGTLVECAQQTVQSTQICFLPKICEYQYIMLQNIEE